MSHPGSTCSLFKTHSTQTGGGCVAKIGSRLCASVSAFSSGSSERMNLISRTSTRSHDMALFQIARVDRDADRLCKPGDASVLLLSPFDTGVTLERCVRADNLVLELDDWARSAFLEGQVVAKEIPARDPPSLK